MEGTGEGCGFFCSPKSSYLSTMSQQFCRRLQLLQHFSPLPHMVHMASTPGHRLFRINCLLISYLISRQVRGNTFRAIYFLSNLQVSESYAFQSVLQSYSLDQFLRHSISTTAAQRKRSKAKNLKTSTCLKHVQDCATRLIVKGRYNLITLIPRELHWLPVDQLILFFIYKAFRHLTPLYIQDFNTIYSGTPI